MRALAERFVDGRLSDEALAGMTDNEVETALTEVSGIGPWTAHEFLIFALDHLSQKARWSRWQSAGDCTAASP